MFLEKIKTTGLAHLSYIFGDGGDACVIDPRRDIEKYIEIARNEGCIITTILETHRNEDLVSGSSILAEHTGATIYHGPHADGDVEYATIISETSQFSFGSLKIEVLETPGHTKDSLSFLLFDSNYDQGPVGIFTGDALFIGDVGRTDFYQNEKEKLAGMLYDSLKKIQKHASNAILYPAHGAGSVCGDGMAEREFSTIAHEFENNSMLSLERNDFIEKKVGELHYVAPYFKQMEELNLKGATTSTSDIPKPYNWEKFKERYKDNKNIKVIDVRSVESFLGTYVPGSLCLPLDMLSAYAGWLLNYDEHLFLIADDASQAQQARLHLSRIGFDKVTGFLETSLPMVAAQGGEFEDLNIVDTEIVKSRMQDTTNWALLDVRKDSEFKDLSIDGAQNIYLGNLIKNSEELNSNKHYTVMCGSGIRATVGASILKFLNFEKVDVYMGSMMAWKNAGLEVVN